MRVHQLVQHHHQLLGASHGEAGTMILPPRPAVRFTTSASFSATFATRLVEPVAVGALHDQIVDWIGRDRVAQNRQVLAADVAGEGQAHAVGLDDHGSRAQHVSGFVGPIAESGSHFLVFAQLDRAEQGIHVRSASSGR